MFTFEDAVYKDILHIDNLTIRKGSMTALLGESGTGKSTMLKLMNHLVSADKGVIRFQATPVQDWDAVELRREAAMLSQQPVLFGDTVKENLEAGCRFAGKPLPSEEQMKHSIQQYDLQKELDDDAETLSGGEQQRLALARLTLLDPPVCLLDEPTSALDEGLEHEVMEAFIEHARNKKKTVVFVTHSRSIADAYADETIDITPFSYKGRKVNE
ncbi:ABC transporter ATP-binding protein [Salibacterium halotolerans]|uniref:Putative ABC transport system ATP-binding protein n=1 Tax=Salibacterium halotolerans TaxID=1884432 RepID=A0A1I5TQV9_9BACI|nr:ABC transporter ATP-binding protein [Salibacterium halotolerans]SFP85281.1 putative ABC transport system ATP-binding protein [Salibacterium halotolerans]